jgi:glycosyltransferase involved in cell wall biosynthesis
MVPKKGLQTTLEAFAMLRGRFPRARLFLAGDGPLLEELRAGMVGRGLPADAVQFPGFLAEQPLLELLKVCHLFFHLCETPVSVNREGVPNAMLEAMATGLPVVATRHGGIPEAVTDGGYLVAERDAPALAAAMERVLAAPGSLGQMGRAARAAVASKFASDQQIAHLERTYLDLMGKTQGLGCGD